MVLQRVWILILNRLIMRVLPIHWIMQHLKMNMKIIHLLNLDVKVLELLVMHYDNINIRRPQHIICKSNKKKIEANLRGYDSVIDYLLQDQEVTKDMFDRQIDVIMSDLAPVMQKYAKIIQRVHNLDKMRFEDLKFQ